MKCARKRDANEPVTDFWTAVQELAAMRRFVPKERRAMSGVRQAVRLDLLPKKSKP